MKRLLIAIVVLVSCIILLDLLLSLPALVQMSRMLLRGDHIAVGDIIWHSDGRLLLDIFVLLLLGMFSYWFSGRLVKPPQRRQEDLNS